MVSGAQRGRRGNFFWDNELVLVSAIMVMLLLISAVSQRPDAKVPDWVINNPNYHAGPEPEQNHTPVRTEIQLLSKDGNTAEGQSTEESLTVEQEGTVSFDIKLTWTDDYGSNDEFKLAVSNATGEIDSSSGISGSLELKYAPASAGPADLVGKYTITVTCVNAPGVIGPLPVDRDNGNSWKLVVTAVVEA
jgi:hypothetical protein